MLAKQRRKAGEEASAEGQVGRVQTIDALLLAIKRRLRTVQEAMAQDAIETAAAEEAQQGQQQEAVGSLGAATATAGKSTEAQPGADGHRSSMQAQQGAEQCGGSLVGMQLQ
jgi:hypothetical protein